ncbi:YqzL family protein [Oceanobacillus polygoni]
MLSAFSQKIILYKLIRWDSMSNFIWRVFKETGSVGVYLLLKKLEGEINNKGTVLYTKRP